jgi:hypothetical protein
MSDLNEKPERPRQAILQGRQARAQKDAEGRRELGPFKIRLQVQMSKLSVVSDTLEFFTYQSTGENAVSAASMLLKKWYILHKKVFDGFPKPNGLGAAIPISDQEFRMTWQQAEHEGRELEKAGDQADPVAFHIRPRNTTIITLGKN